MSTNLFGLTAASLRKHMFPAWNDFSAMSSPDATTVGELIEEEAGELAAKLYAENINAAAILVTTDGNSLHSPAWLWCLKTLRLMAALRVLRVTTQQDPALAQAYSDQLKVRLDDLGQNGSSALGDASLDTGTSSADGPHSHVTVYRLTPDSGADMSSPIPSLRMGDDL